jgi:hypothetical protein
MVGPRPNATYVGQKGGHAKVARAPCASVVPDPRTGEDITRGNAQQLFSFGDTAGKAPIKTVPGGANASIIFNTWQMGREQRGWADHNEPACLTADTSATPPQAVWSPCTALQAWKLPLPPNATQLFFFDAATQQIRSALEDASYCLAASVGTADGVEFQPCRRSDLRQVWSYNGTMPAGNGTLQNKGSSDCLTSLPNQLEVQTRTLPEFDYGMSIGSRFYFFNR